MADKVYFVCPHALYRHSIPAMLPKKNCGVFMCFSAAVSFSSSAVLLVASAYAATRVETKADRMLAAIPLLFAVQQFIEGWLWIFLLHAWHPLLIRAATYGFLLFAQVIWVVWIPTTVLVAEAGVRRGRWLRVLMLFGVLLAFYLVICMVSYPTVAIAEKHHIRYVQQAPLINTWFFGLIYFVPTILAPLISSNRRLRILGVFLLVSYAAARLFFHHYEVSVWCFFATIISFIAISAITSTRKGVTGMGTMR